nr:DUF4890 domain-containing protein [uncultured Bacteroides sp.]
MNRLFKTGLVALFSCLVWTGMAQQQVDTKLPHEVPSPAKIAKKMTDEMSKELQLNEKQYAKIYKLNLKEQKERFKAQQSSAASNSERPPMGGRPSFDGSENERPPMPSGERPEMGMRPGGGSAMNEDAAEALHKAEVKKEKKIQKILTGEQYAKWGEMQKKMKKGMKPEMPKDHKHEASDKKS